MPAFNTAFQQCTGTSSWVIRQGEKTSKWKRRRQTISIHRWHDPIFREFQRIHQKMRKYGNYQRTSAKLQSSRSTRKPQLCIYMPAVNNPVRKLRNKITCFQGPRTEEGIYCKWIREIFGDDEVILHHDCGGDYKNVHWTKLNELYILKLINLL